MKLFKISTTDSCFFYVRADSLEVKDGIAILNTHNKHFPTEVAAITLDNVLCVRQVEDASEMPSVLPPQSTTTLYRSEEEKRAFFEGYNQAKKAIFERLTK